MSRPAKRKPNEEPAAEGLPEKVERRLDPLYQAPPEEFVAARDALSRELRAEGDRESAARVKKLRRPSAAAWVINRVSADNPEGTRDFVIASEELSEAQQRVLAGEVGGDELRQAAARERAAMDRYLAEARTIAAGRGGNIEVVMERVAETLRAVGSDADLRGRVLRGRVEKEQSAATVGLPAGMDVAPRRRAKKAAGPDAAEVARAQRELKRLRRELADAEARRDRKQEAVDAAEANLRRAKSELAESKRAVRELERKIAGAERRAGE